jgi:hypothetical protein
MRATPGSAGRARRLARRGGRSGGESDPVGGVGPAAGVVGPGPYDAATQAGIDAGMAAAEAILALREADGSATPHLPYTLGPAPGVCQPTPNPEFPAVITPSFAGWTHVTPFALRHGAQFEVEPGPSST